jgi:2-phospho-L-lactate transferase/gluconeogenesis factor (CofD/UPF0052 family)
MRSITRRLSSLGRLTWPLVLTFVGVVLLSLGVAYLFIHAYRTIEGLPQWVTLLTLQFLPRPWRGVLLLAVGLAALAAGIWQLSGVVVIPLGNNAPNSDDLVLGFRRDTPPSIAVLSGGPGMLVLSAMGEHVRRLTCVVPVHDPVEYYYRAAGLFAMQNVYYVVPTPEPARVVAELDDGTQMDVRHLAFDASVAERHVAQLHLERDDDRPLHVTRLAADAIAEADAIILGPGSLFESILPNLLIDELREAIAASKARKIYVCNLMTEPGRTTGFGVADHIRALKQYGVTPDFVLLNVQRIDAEIYRLYAAAQQSPVALAPDEVEETTVLAGDRTAQRRVMVEGAVVIEADLASSVVQYTASLSNPSESRAVRVLRHDSQKLAATILELLRRT